MVKHIRFRIPVSVDGGLTYGKDVYMDDGDFVIDGILPLDDGGFLTGSASPSDAAISQAVEVLPNPNTVEGVIGPESTSVLMKHFAARTLSRRR